MVSLTVSDCPCGNGRLVISATSDLARIQGQKPVTRVVCQNCKTSGPEVAAPNATPHAHDIGAVKAWNKHVSGQINKEEG